MATDVTPGQTEPESLSDQVKRQMNKPLIHQSWETTYRTEGNERFFEQAYDYIVDKLKQPKDSLALDIGCGIGANSVRLAKRGYRVIGGDYSESILGPANENIAKKGVADRIQIQREDILNLSFPDNHFDLVLCWGVLMHIPAAERAIQQLTRVAKPGGYIVFEEINESSPEGYFMRAYWKLLKGKSIKAEKKPSGIEHQSQFGGETLFWRHANRKWLINELASHSCKFVGSGSGMCTDMYMYLPGKPLQSLSHAWNRFWLKRVNVEKLAYHNILIFQKS